MATNDFVDLPPMREAKILADYTGIDYDLKTARQFAELYLAEWDKPHSKDGLYDALMVATIIRYARSFSGVRSPLPKAVDILTPEQVERHNYF